MTAIDKQISERLRTRRIELGYSQKDLASAVGMSPQQLFKYEKGYSRVPGGWIYTFANALDVPAQYFFEKVVKQNNEPMESRQRFLFLSRLFRRMPVHQQKALVKFCYAFVEEN